MYNVHTCRYNLEAHLVRRKESILIRDMQEQGIPQFRRNIPRERYLVLDRLHTVHCYCELS